MVYLDNAATTPLRREVLEAMAPYLGPEFGNPSGVHRQARAARRALDDARETLAAVLCCEPGELVLTSGGTEADNLAVTGAALHAIGSGAPGPVVCCSAIEHPGVLEPVRFLGGVEIPVDRDGVVDLDALAAVLEVEGERVTVVSVMLANNETGVLEPVGEVARLVHEIVPAALVHSDAVQALRWLDVAAETEGADLVSVTAHKLGGPKGAGALIARNGSRSRLSPIIRGGPQERELRAGTPNVAGFVGFAAAAELAAAERDKAMERATRLGDRLLEGIRGAAATTPAVERARKLPSIVNIGFPGVESEELLIALDEQSISASAGSACASGALEPSPVLSAMGIDAEQARTHIRLSLGTQTTEEDIDLAVKAIAEAVGRLEH